MNLDRLHAIRAELSDVRDVLDTVQAHEGDDGGPLWQVAEAAKGLAWALGKLADAAAEARAHG